MAETSPIGHHESMMNSKPAIVVVAYDRPACLARLLSSLVKADYSNFSDVPLVISVDKSEVKETLDTARAFSWPHGSVRIVERQTRLGWFEHVIACADLTTEYEAIILLEDDLYVAPGFYNFASQALDFYCSDPAIAGISLYSLKLNEYTDIYLPFQPLQDRNSVFFLRKGVPWGWAVSKDQWQRFRQWFAGGPRLVSMHEDIPARVISWPASSFNKCFIKYLVACDRYIVYPRKSLSVNFGPSGVHRSSPSHVFQVILDMTVTQPDFVAFNDSLAVYDACHELVPERLNRLCDHFSGFSYAVDLYGTKDLGKIDADYILTTKRSVDCIRSFAMCLMPMELNVIEDLPGDDIRFCKKTSALGSESLDQDQINKFLSYFYAERPFDASLIAELTALRNAFLDKELAILALKEEFDRMRRMVDGRDIGSAIKGCARTIVKRILRKERDG
jgi:hypothetical protein